MFQMNPQASCDWILMQLHKRSHHLEKGFAVVLMLFIGIELLPAATESMVPISFNYGNVACSQDV